MAIESSLVHDAWEESALSDTEADTNPYQLRISALKVRPKKTANKAQKNERLYQTHESPFFT